MSAAPASTPAEQNRPGKLEISGVHKSFETASQTVSALAPVSMEIKEGEFVVFVGPSGCGKSTLLNMIAGFIAPTSGKILLDGKDVAGPGPDRLMMFQEPALFPWLSVIDNVCFGLKGKKLRRGARKERARELLRTIHLEKFENASIHELSGGMKQRVALARALAPNPAVLLIDEPFNALDAVVKLELYSELQRIHQESGKTIIFVTHSMQEAACLGDRVLVMSGSPGKITHEVKIDLARPRDFNDPKVIKLAAELMGRLQENQDNAKSS